MPGSWQGRASGMATEPGREGGKNENKSDGAMIPGDGPQSMAGGGRGRKRAGQKGYGALPLPRYHAGTSGLACEGLAAPTKLSQFLDSDGKFGGRYWDRTSDPSRVKGVLSR